MPLPHGRLSLPDLYQRTGITRTEFYSTYRNDPRWQDRLDIRPVGRTLTVADTPASRAAMAEIAAARVGQRATTAMTRARNLGPHAKKGALPPSMRGRPLRLAV